MAVTPVPLPPPYLGQKDDVPLVTIQSPYAERVVNFNVDDGAARLRKGDDYWATIGGSSVVLTTAVYGSGTSQQLFFAIDAGGASGIVFYENNTQGTSTVVNTIGAPSGDDEIHQLFFNNVLTFFGETSLIPTVHGNPTYNGTAWGTSGYTYPVGFIPFGGTPFKNRAYVIARNSTKYAYSGINAISGAMTEVDLAQIVSQKGNLYGIRSVSLSEGLEQEVVICFLFDTGEVLAYSGSYPNSPDWSLVGRFIIPPPVYYNAFVDANGDSFVITGSDLVSLRSLFTQGTNVATINALSKSISKRWKQTVGYDWVTGLGLQFYIKGIFDSQSQRLTIFVPNDVDLDGVRDANKMLRLVYSFETNSWVEHKITQPGGFSTVPVYYKKKLIYGCLGGTLAAESGSGVNIYKDYQLQGGTLVEGYEFEITSAPISSKGAYVLAAQGMDIILESDFYPETDYQFIANTGVLETVAQKIPTQASTLQMPNANIGIEGNYIQYKISGTTLANATDKTVGINIYGLNIQASQGTSLR